MSEQRIVITEDEFNDSVYNIAECTPQAILVSADGFRVECRVSGQVRINGQDFLWDTVVTLPADASPIPDDDEDEN